jgi:NAD(P)-dependent dehydrogenase (short-subunit alcohol dehydrogenase family)
MTDNKRFTGKAIAIIGCATGLGNGMARQFASEGANLALADVNEEKLAALAEVARNLGAQVVTMRVDVSNRDEVNGFAVLARSTYGHLGIVCSNAGVAEMAAPAWEKSDNDWKWVFGVNFFGLVNAANAFLPDMIDQQTGHFVATVSNSALIAPTNMATYTSSKKAALGYCETLRHDLDQIGSPVVVSAICPGKMDTEMPYNMQARPEAFPGRAPSDEEARLMKAFLADGGLSADEAAAIAIEGIAEQRFFILTDRQDAEATVAWAHALSSSGQLAGLDSDKSRFRGIS